MGISAKKAPEQTNAETQYLRQLVQDHVPVTIRLEDNSEVTGVIEFFDVSFLRLTRDGAPNLFVFKHDIKYLYERP